MKIAILTTFSDLKPSFSLATVVRQQLITLVKQGHKPVLITLDIFKDKVPEGVELRPILPQLILEPYSNGDVSNLPQDATKAQEAMEKHMTDIDVCLTHDIIFINSYLPYNVAMRDAIRGKLSHIRWLHWMHSGPSFADLDGSVWDNLYTLPDNSKLVYMNYTDAIRAAEMYHTKPSNVRTIFNPMDIREFHNFSPITKELIDEYDLMSPELICTYALSTTRMDAMGKQLSKVIKIMGFLKKKGFSVALIVPNAHANAQREKDEIERMYQIAHQYGLERRELIFTSLFNVPEYEQGVPHEVVRDLSLLSNLFIFPSVSENCPLILLEAMASKNILVLNQDFPAFKDFGQENAIYFNFAALTGMNPEYPRGEDNYLSDVATLIVDQYEQHKAIKANTRLRREFNVDWIWTHQLEPAIYGK